MNRFGNYHCIRRRRLRVEQLEDRRLLAGPYAPAAGEIGSTAVSKDDLMIEAWATEVVDYSPGSNLDAEFQSPIKAIGPAEGTSGDAVSLGRGGEITLTFDAPIRDGLGADFVVFENGVADTFLELGFVEVSSDGANFFRFESDSRTPSPVDAFGQVDPTDLNNLAGKYRQGFGTPFDLKELFGISPLLNTASVTHVRIIDIVGDGSQRDASGDVIYDPFPTVGSAGFDLDAIGVIRQAKSGRDVIGFEDVGAALSPGSDFHGPDPAGSTITGPFGDSVVVGSFQSETLSFNNAYSTDFGSWNGWAYSNLTDTTTRGFTNQFSSFAGGGANGSATFAIGFPDQGNFFDPPTISREAVDGRQFESLMVTNTTYAALSMLHGDSFAKKFGGPSGSDEDYLLLTITGKDSRGAAIGTVEFYLADYRFTESAMDYIVAQWTRVDLTSIAEARTLEFAVSSSDVGPFGINTPAFFAVDEITLVKPGLLVDIADPQVLESAGQQATVVRISRSDNDTTVAIDVAISPVNAQVAVLPSSVTIPSGTQFVEFPINIVDNDLHDADRAITIEASAAGYEPASRVLTIQDDDVRRLTLSLNENRVVEGNSLTATVSRNDADLTSAVIVHVGSSGSSLISLNDSVTIPAGQSSTTFAIHATEDQVDQPDTQVPVSVSAADYLDATVLLDVIDNDQPGVSIETETTAVFESVAGQSARLEDVGRQLPPESFYNGADAAGGFTSGDLLFNNEFDFVFGSWSGWSYSNTTDTTTPGFTNQYSAATGIGASGSDTYAVASTYTLPTITRDPTTTHGFRSIAITNTTYAALSMRQGDDFAKKFGGPTGDDPDFFLLTIEGVDAADSSIGKIEFYLADYRFTDNRMDYIVEDWTTVDLSPIASAVQLKFSLTSSDVGGFGMNTPAYFAADNVALTDSSRQPVVVIRRNTVELSEPLVVSLASDDPDKVRLPSTATIPAGALETQLPLTIVDDDLFAGDHHVTLTVSAESHVSSSVVVTVLDDESPVLWLSISTGSLSESNGEGRAVLHRNSADTALPLVAELSVDLENQVTLPDLIIIPAGQRSVEFTFTAQDNSIVDEDRTVTLQASAEGFTAAEGSVLIVNDDVPPPTLSLVLDRNRLSESDAPPTIQFEDVGALLPEESFDNGADLAAGFTSGVASFNNTYDPTFGVWGGWSVSNSTDRTTPGFANQYSASPGGGAGDSATFAIASAFPGGTVPSISLANSSANLSFESLMITNSTYAALSMAEGDGFAKKFGGETGDDPDFFLLTIEGRDAADNTVGTVDFYLADYRFSDNSQDYIVEQWTVVDVSSLNAAKRLDFSLSSTDVGEFGMNTPAYFAIDNVVLSGENPVIANGTVTREHASLDEPLVVSLAVDDSSEVTVASTVTIPGGDSSSTFEIRAADDAVVDGDRVVHVSVSADNYRADSAELFVSDDDVATLTVSFADEEVVESDGSSATSLLIHRNTQDTTTPLEVTLVVADGDLRTPGLVAIPSGASTLVVEIGVQDNMTLDGHRIATLEPVAEGFASVGATLGVRDDDVAALLISESGDDTSVDELLGEDTFAISLSAQPRSSVVVELNVFAGGVTLDVDRIEFTPEQWNQPRVVTVQGVPDLVSELDELETVRVVVDADVSDAAFALAEDVTLDLHVQDYQPSTLRLDENDQGVYFEDADTRVRFATADHRDGIEVLANHLQQTIIVNPLELTDGPIEVDASAGDDTVVVLGTRFSWLDGGVGFDQLVLNLDQPVELVDFLNGRVVGFEEIVIASETAAELQIDMGLLRLVVADDEALLIQADVDQNLRLVGSATIDRPIMVGDSFAQVIRSGNASLNVVSQTPWQNVLDHWDVNGSGEVTALDALAVVNQLARSTESLLPVIASVEQFPGMYFDVSGDGEITALDALRVINEISRRESSGAAEEPSLFQPAMPARNRSAEAINTIIEPAIAQTVEKLVLVSSRHAQTLRDLCVGQIEDDDGKPSDAQSRPFVGEHLNAKLNPM